MLLSAESISYETSNFTMALSKDQQNKFQTQFDEEEQSQEGVDTSAGM